MASRFLVYGLDECSFCKSAKELLIERKRRFVYFELEHDPEFLVEVKAFYGFLTVPIILENNLDTGRVRFVGGYSDLVEWPE